MDLVVERRVANPFEQIFGHFTLHSKCNGCQICPHTGEFRPAGQMAGVDRTFAAQRGEDDQHECHRITLSHGFGDPTLKLRIVVGKHRC